MAIFVGGNEITAGKLEVGGQAVQEVYVGSQLVFQNAPANATVVSIQSNNSTAFPSFTVTDQGAGTLFVAVTMMPYINSPGPGAYTVGLNSVSANTISTSGLIQFGLSPFNGMEYVVATWRQGTVPDGSRQIQVIPASNTGLQSNRVTHFYTISGADQTNGGVIESAGLTLSAAAIALSMSAASGTLCVGGGGQNSNQVMDAPSALTAGLVASDNLGTGVASYAMTMAATASLDQTLSATLTEAGGGGPLSKAFCMLAIPGA